MVPAALPPVESPPVTRSILLAGALLALVSAAPALAADPAPTGAAAPARKAVKVVFKTKIPAPPEGSKRLEAWVPTPMVDDVQTVRDLKVEASVPYELTHDPATGNRYVHVLVENPRGEVTVDWTAVVERSVDSGQGRAPVAEAHLKSDALAPVDDRARKIAEDVGATDPRVPVRERAKAIYDHVLQSMAYDKTPDTGWGRGDFARACEVGKGNCSDFTAKFVTLARAAGIPARWTTTISLAGDHMDCTACGYTCYAHYRDGDRWVPVNASDARRIVAKDPKKAAWYFGHAEASNVVLSVGRDLVLVPKQRAGPVNFLAWAYVEVDGKPFEIPATNRTYGHEPVDGSKAGH
jgi:transglutaminase-like putative cysteine protease